ncbi:hypothetical protein PCANC_11144 [Puccinia coronata f. sp. avenae]|uniref:Uncharacterized protein n=1 Tax=Puccinia coronata f. sp. avenae TaxID=200324 RepID=A0A2N5V8Y5_9BASI|nr:hypothetical protein PCANC_11144 [Puccinia coronata f. sp. avenae]
MPVPVEPITTAVMAKYIYQQEGTAGLVRWIGTPPQMPSELMDREMEENQGPMRSTHMMGLVWSRIVHQDWVGLSSVVDWEMNLKYKLVLTGLLTTIILAGLIATRAPKPMTIKMLQKLIKQCPSSPHHHALNKNHHHHLSHACAKLDSMQAFLHLIHAADAVGDFLLIKELREAMVANCGREKLWAEEGCAGCLDYVDLVFQAKSRCGPAQSRENVGSIPAAHNFFRIYNLSQLE